MLPLRLPPDGLLPGPPLPTGSLPAGWVVRASFSPPARQTCRAHKEAAPGAADGGQPLKPDHIKRRIAKQQPLPNVAAEDAF